jgi:uncharacterized spore protein YtfJ
MTVLTFLVLYADDVRMVALTKVHIIVKLERR